MTVSSSTTCVLMIGPLQATGGMASVMRLQLRSRLREQFTLVYLDNSKRTSPGRSWWEGLIAQVQIFRELRSLLKAHRPAVVHLHTCSGVTFYRTIFDQWLARRMGSAVVVQIHGGRFENFLREQRGVLGWLVRRALRQADQVLVLSPDWARRIGAFDSNIRLAVVANGVPVTGDEESSAKKPDDDDPFEPPVRLVMVGNLRVSKGVDDLISAIELLPKGWRARLQVRIIGPDPDDRRGELLYRLQQRQLQDTIHLPGLCTSREVAVALQAADIFMLPSHWEALPMAWLEAMAAGLPTIVTRVGAIPEIARDGEEALLVEPKSPEQLASALLRLLENEPLRRSMGRQGQQLVQQHYSQDSVASHLQSIYQGLAAGGAA
ncbi:MAG: D-inositol-3-phosphate glycosyltransferase [Phycisphaerae bacterium]|nr:D-inositol-3-phosphate glycosyltransferase [Phycisphaerae bacterium]